MNAASTTFIGIKFKTGRIIVIQLNSVAKSEILKEHFRGFHQDYSDIQRKAILISLFDIANSDNVLHKSELKFFHEVSALMGYSMEDNTIYRYLELDRQYIQKVLEDLGPRQKEWFIVTVIGMIYSDGTVSKQEVQFVEDYLQNIGVSKHLFKNSLRKGKLLIGSIG